MIEEQTQGWHSALTARIYEDYAQTQTSYRETARDLVAYAQLRSGITLIDLACGTGIVIEELLRHLDETSQVIGVDSSQEMLAVAQRKIHATNVHFVCSSAERLDAALPLRAADRIVCNSAFWQVRMDEAVRAIRNVLHDGYFAFNFPQSYFRFSEDESIPTPSSMSLSRLMQDIAMREYGFVPPQSTPQRFRPYDFARVQNIFNANGMIIESHMTIEYPKTAEEGRAFLTIPIMTERQFPGLSYETRMEILSKAWEQHDQSGYSNIWTYFLARKE